MEQLRGVLPVGEKCGRSEKVKGGHP